MFRPNNFVFVSKCSEESNLYGEKQYGEPKRYPCGIVKLIQKSERTTVRADSSASRGNAYEVQVEGKILFPKTHPVKIGDKIQKDDIIMRVISTHPRYAIPGGALDHYEVDLDNWFE